MIHPPDNSFRAFLRSPAGILLVLGTAAFFLVAALVTLMVIFGFVPKSGDLPMHIPTTIIIDGQPYIL